MKDTMTLIGTFTLLVNPMTGMHCSVSLTPPIVVLLLAWYSISALQHAEMEMSAKIIQGAKTLLAKIWCKCKVMGYQYWHNIMNMMDLVKQVA